MLLDKKSGWNVKAWVADMILNKRECIAEKAKKIYVSNIEV